MKQHIIVIVLAVGLVAGVGGFFGGMKYAQINRRAQFSGQFRGPNGGSGTFGDKNGNQPAGRQSFRPVTGEISSADGTGITVKLPDGSSKIILVNDKTTINKSSDATKNDLVTGTHVTVFGSLNQDGSLTAQNVQIGSLMMMRGPQGDTNQSSPTATP